MSILRSIIFVIIMLGVLATLHELGHFWVARLLKIKVFEVSIFVGPKLISWKHKDVNFTIRLIPIGAYVRFTEIDEAGYVVNGNEPDLLINQPRFKRLLVSLAGPVMNLILGFLIFVAMFCVTGFVSTEIGPAIEGTQTYEVASEYTPGDDIRRINGNKIYTTYDLYYELDAADPAEPMTLTLRSQETGKDYDLVLTPVIRNRAMLGITVNMADEANQNGGMLVHSVDEDQNDYNPVLKPGDYITHINGVSVSDEEFEEFIYNVTDDVLTVTYIRDGVTMEDEIIPHYVDYATARGIRLMSYVIDSPSHFFAALGYAAKMPATIGNISIRGIKDIIAGKEKAYNLVSGPIGITTMVNDVVKDEKDTVGEKIYVLIMLSAVISIALAFSNLLPIPGLDGIQIIFIVVEMVIGHKLSEKAEKWLTVVGFVIIILLVVFAFISDILRIIFGY
ncbi:MAG: RIP metalloprotease RseP [Clostridiales bacterium]|jgi:regulator of sigma E protease|nr:RIP metalloprotease RseP [Clostridiales bacterium]